jgi:2-dehydropantoate 2-reductase
MMSKSVDRKKSKVILLVGRGRIARHFQFYLKETAHEVLLWDRSQSEASLLEKIKSASVVALAISDSAIENFYHQFKSFNPRAQWLHFSGALEVSGVISCHPLMSFGFELYSLEFYEKILLVSTNTKQLHESLDLTNPMLQLSTEEKPRYHALCVLAGNFSQLLWQKFLQEAAALRLPSSALELYAKQSLTNIFEDPASALTGPLVRGDLKTQAQNLLALKDDPFQEVYLAFQKVFSKTERASSL